MRLRLIPLLAASLVLAACAQHNAQPETGGAFQLAIGHINDHHSNLQPAKRTSVTVDGETHRIETGGFPRVVTQIDAIRKRHDNMLALHAGDAISGTLFYTVFEGVADAALMNQACFDAMALGNHEFDNGDAGLKTFLNALAMSDCATAVLGANVMPEVGVSPLTPKTRWDSFKPYAVYQFGDEKVGIIGLDIAVKTKQSSMPDATTEFADEYTTAAYYVDELRQLGIEKIGLLTHIQFSSDLELAQKLPAVDFIIGGDSHTWLGDYAAYGLDQDGPYPAQTMNRDGAPVCIAHAGEYTQIVGELVIDFIGDQVSHCGGQPHLLVSEEAPEVIKALLHFTAVAEDKASLLLLAEFQQQLEEMTTQSIAQVEQRMCMKRLGVATTPGCGIGRQSDAHRLVAEAFLFSAPQADFALQNGGGVRNEIAAGPLTIADVYRLLPFSNTLVTVEITGAELRTLLEQALAYALSEGGSDGAYPHGAGIRFDVDMTATSGERISNLEINQDGQWQRPDDSQTYTMVTNSFLALGSDGWKLLAEINADGRVTDTFVNYAQSFVDWARAQQRITRPESHSTQLYIPPAE
ncbi:hypothetical protein IDSA_05720 [Pseudidiomarina salinarum]|uniref:5'-nucleotidase n=1 Tax=Pseudidiomarina salinarum TaxID=435908 RepID=A0A094JBX1_9GAMM|nr:5'-nucleotidase C-terminal domain-containing protein [Pseudidiomarina salinarum]KFZ30086.1 hypothetical protein IDSA_05720 [Pseudidiomarina salinarum]RUO70057.1 bifunctional metallophosphatase/5'-nucleotidase [Pseudidiomarina salinarum]